MEKHLYRSSLDKQTQEPAEKLTQRAGWHDIEMHADGSIYLDYFSSNQQPPQVSLHRADGERLTWLNENRLDSTHPYTPYVAKHQGTEFGSLTAEDGQTLNYRLIRPDGFVSSRKYCLLYTSPSPRDLSTSRMPSSA